MRGLGETSRSSSDESSVAPARDDVDRVDFSAGLEVGAESVVSEESSVLRVAEEPRKIFAIGLVNARACARAVIHRELVAPCRMQATHEAPGTGGILEREASLAT